MLSAKAKAFSIDSLLAVRPGVGGELAIADSPTRTHDVAVCHRDHPTKRHTISKCFHQASQTVTDDTSTSSIQMELCQNELWHAFHNLGTEMIITKTGRRMFPAIRIKLHGLEPDYKYSVSLEFSQLDKQKYRYVYHSSKWMVSGLGDEMIRDQIYRHPDSPTEGAALESQIVSFERIKLTNNDSPKYGQISLLSMQRFVPRLHVHQISADGRTVRHFVTSFPQTSFTAVTAYQNQEITKLKIARNPFAKGFREAGKNRSSLEAMLDTFAVNGARPRCNPTPPKRQLLGTQDEKTGSLALFLSGKEMRLFTNEWPSPAPSSAHAQLSDQTIRYPYILQIQAPPFQRDTHSQDCLNCEPVSSLESSPGRGQNLQQSPGCQESPHQPVCSPDVPLWCSKMPVPVSPSFNFEPPNVSSNLLKMFRYSLNK